MHSLNRFATGVPCRWLIAPMAVRLLLAIALLAGAWPGSPVRAQGSTPAAAQQAAISAQLTQELATASAPVSFLVVLKDQVDTRAALAADGLAAATATARRSSLYHTLTTQAAATQAPLRAWLDARGVAYRPFYLVNMIEVTGDQALADALRLRPEVDRLARNPAWRQAQPPGLETPAPSLAVNAARLPATLPYGLTYTKADQVWALGYRGQGIVVASQDTGVEWDHPALIGAYRGWNTATLTVTHAYNWFDAIGRDPLKYPWCAADPQIPCDDYGHGTHTVGTMAGDATPEGGTVLGMAPAAKWIGCRNMGNGKGTPASYTDCFQFFLAPYPQGGDPFTDGKPELAPNIVNNSWGCPVSEGCDVDSLRQIVETVRAAGIFVAASAGNEGGAGCASVATPIALYDATFSVGAHSESGMLASFSSRGPVIADGSNRRKPDLTAPGVKVYSTYTSRSYTDLSGTSMASPHLAGAVALLWSAVPSLIGDVDRTEQVLLKSAVAVPSLECGTSPTAVSPNNLYGFGRLNILAAVDLALHPQPVVLALLDGAGNPIVPVAAALVDQLTGFSYAANNLGSGSASWSAIYTGAYDVVYIDINCNNYRRSTQVGPQVFQDTAHLAQNHLYNSGGQIRLDSAVHQRESEPCQFRQWLPTVSKQ